MGNQSRPVPRLVARWFAAVALAAVQPLGDAVRGQVNPAAPAVRPGIQLRLGDPVDSGARTEPQIAPIVAEDLKNDRHVEPGFRRERHELSVSEPGQAAVKGADPGRTARILVDGVDEFARKSVFDGVVAERVILLDVETRDPSRPRAGRRGP